MLGIIMIGKFNTSPQGHFLLTEHLNLGMDQVVDRRGTGHEKSNELFLLLFHKQVATRSMRSAATGTGRMLDTG